MKATYRQGLQSLVHRNDHTQGLSRMSHRQRASRQTSSNNQHKHNQALTTTVQSSVPTFTIGNLAPSLYLLYYYYPSYFYVTQSTLPVQSYNLTGIPNFMFESYGGQNGVYYVILGQWNPVNGLGQINVYGLDGALKLISHR